MDNRYNLYNLEAPFKQFLLAEKVSSITLKNYLSDLRHFLGWLVLKAKSHELEVKKETDLISIINEAIIEDYKSYLIENRIPIKTVNRRLSTLRKFCTFCITQNWMKENPAKKITNHKLIVTEYVMPNTTSAHQIVKQYENSLVDKGIDQKIITNYLDDIQEFLSL